MVAHLERERIHVETVQAWREWLLTNHESSDGVWLVSWRTAAKAADKTAKGERAR